MDFASELKLVPWFLVIACINKSLTAKNFYFSLDGKKLLE